ncbi:hypothetical protein IGI04_019276 [Brassica rapa subsp. trilocularis]|uniref:Uncharacterized protein n=1 Tax=Brassica rapa subsp. trilocularis TaxID=1813537 RepID=A0ABQ7MFC2_BRACM|nr:hypothetical protein IGI04_019276 [Brassica rapa subsp. trilocularis]
MDLVYPAGRAGIRKNWSLSPSSYDHRTSLSPSSVPDWSLLLEELLHIISKNMDDCFDVVHAHSVGTLCAMLRIEMAGREMRVGTSQLPSVAHVLMKIGVQRACTAQACASRGSGLGSSSRNCIPRGPVPRRPALTVYCSGAEQGGSVQPNFHIYL